MGISGVALLFSLFLGPQSPVHTHKIGQESQTVISLFPACTSAPVLRRPSRGSLNAHAEGACGADVACPIPSPGGCLYTGHHPAVSLRAAGPGWNLPAHPSSCWIPTGPQDGMVEMEVEHPRMSCGSLCHSGGLVSLPIPKDTLA